ITCTENPSDVDSYTALYRFIVSASKIYGYITHCSFFNRHIIQDDRKFHVVKCLMQEKSLSGSVQVPVPSKSRSLWKGGGFFTAPVNLPISPPETNNRCWMR